MSELFLSASVPYPGRGDYYASADPFLIQLAVRELICAVIREHTVVWGGHPAITPMVWAVCEDLGVDYAQTVILYQSAYFADAFPEENARFGNVIVVPAVESSRESSLALMRSQMLSRAGLKAAVFIGGMEGIEDEFRIFREYHPHAGVLALAAPGGAARDLASSVGERASTVDFARLFRRDLLPMLTV
jgi:hypothetical protein